MHVRTILLGLMVAFYATGVVAFFLFAVRLLQSSAHKGGR